MLPRPHLRALVALATAAALAASGSTAVPASAEPPAATGSSATGSSATGSSATGSSATASSTRTSSALARQLSKVLSDSRVTKGTAVSVVDASTGASLYSRSATMPTTPASNTKLLTAAAALSTLGPNFRFHTDVIHRAPISHGTLQGYLYLKGYGDPTTLQSDYRSLAQQVRRAGITTVSGKLGVDTSYFDNQTYNSHWSKSYAGDYYAARIRPLTIAPNTDYDSGTVLIGYKPGKLGKKPKLTVTPAAAAKAIKIKNTATTTRGSNSIDIDRKYGSNTITVRGKINSGSKGAEQWVTVDRPELVAATVFRDELRRAGVSVRGGTKTMIIPSGLQQRIATDTSMRLTDLLVPFLKLSNNMHAEALTKTMGRVRGKGGSWSGGLSVTTGYLRSIGVPMAGVSLVDGSGLTRSNKITPRAMTTLLTKARTASWFSAYYRALPIAGDKRRMVGGTLRNRMRGTRAAGNAHAKTGTLSGVTALSGYVRGRDGRSYAFSMLSQYTKRTPRPVEDRLVVTLAGWRS